MSLVPSKHISYHCRIAWCACIIFPSAPLHTFNWQAGVNKIHTRRTLAKHSQKQRGGCTFAFVPPLSAPEYWAHQSHIVLFVFQLAPAANQLYKSACTLTPGICDWLAQEIGIYLSGGGGSAWRRCSSFQFIKQINKPPHLQAGRITLPFYGCWNRPASVASGARKLRGWSRHCVNWWQPHGWQPQFVFSCVWDFCPVADEKAYWVFCAQTDSRCWWKRFILRVPKTREDWLHPNQELIVMRFWHRVIALAIWIYITQ